MRYIESPELTELGSELSRSNPAADTRVHVGIELYTTKPASSDRRLLRTLDQQLDSQLLDPTALLGTGDSVGSLSGSSVGLTSSYDAASTSSYLLSPPTTQHENLTAAAAAADNGSAQDDGNGASKKRRAYSTESAIGIASPFGPLDQGGNRKQYAYLIGVLNASDPDRDFSALQPEHFRREWDGVSRIAQSINNTLMQILGSGQLPLSLWDVIGKEVEPRECKIYSLTLPQQFLQDDDSGTVWAKMWFFFNKRRKRVLFLHMQTQQLNSSEESDEDAVLGALD